MLKGKNAIVTGSTSGIGNAVAVALAREGCNIILNGFGDSAAIDTLVRSMQEKHRVTVDYSPADMTRPNEIKEMVEMAQKRFGNVDILVNNAGIQHTDRIENFPEDKWDAIIAINLSAAFHAIRHSIGGMQQRGFGRIINIASVHGLVASVNKSAYVAAKHGIVGLTKVVALENAQSNITCNAICPGWVHTPLVQKQIDALAEREHIDTEAATKKLLGEKQPSMRFVQPEQIGGMVVFLCGPNASAMTGEMMTMDGGWLAQ
ncbi:MAG: 3-hydroxybutyrate dehydrogenase [Alphaproteobacteria bacterium]